MAATEDIIEDCVARKFDADIVDQVRPIAHIICPILIILAGVVDVASIKYQKLTDSMLFIESIM